MYNVSRSLGSICCLFIECYVEFRTATVGDQLLFIFFMTGLEVDLIAKTVFFDSSASV
jgi:hypothetical protein